MKCPHCDATVLTAATPAATDEWELAKFLCEKLALEDFDKMSRTKYRGDAKAILEFLSASPPEQPLRGRESVREIAHKYCTCTCRDDPAVLQNHTNLCDSISDAILEYAVLSSAAPVTEGK